MDPITTRLSAVKLPTGPSWDAVLAGLVLQVVIGLGLGVLLGLAGHPHPVLSMWLVGIGVCLFFAARRIAEMPGAAETLSSRTWKIVAPPADWWRALRICGWPVLACHAVVFLMWLYAG